MESNLDPKRYVFVATVSVVTENEEKAYDIAKEAIDSGRVNLVLQTAQEYHD